MISHKFGNIIACDNTLGKNFNISRGCGQGDPLSGFIFIFTISVLALKLHFSLEIKSLRVNEQQLSLRERPNNFIQKTLDNNPYTETLNRALFSDCLGLPESMFGPTCEIFADDTTICLENCPFSFVFVKCTLDDFISLSGLALNHSKSTNTPIANTVVHPNIQALNF